jgi:hypothetical protein
VQAQEEERRKKGVGLGVAQKGKKRRKKGVGLGVAQKGKKRRT